MEVHGSLVPDPLPAATSLTRYKMAGGSGAGNETTMLEVAGDNNYIIIKHQLISLYIYIYI